MNMFLLAGLMPESLGVFIFGGGMAAAAITLRWYFNKTDGAKSREQLEKTLG